MATAARKRLEGRVVIVTGGSRGVGREAIQRLASLGYAVVVNYLHDQRAAESTVDSVLEDHGAAVAIRADVADDLDVERLFAQTIETFGAVDAVVHSVQGRVSPSSFAEVPFDDFDAMYRTSIRATFIVNRVAAHRVRDGGAIVNVFSSVTESALPAYGAYATAAAAITASIRALALELRGRDITVNGISLDAGKPCSPARIADLVACMLSTDGHAVTGQVIHLDDRPSAEVDSRGNSRENPGQAQQSRGRSV